jgi:uncharacterized UPF0160 family protein
MHPYLISLCEEYVQLVDAMRNGRYTSGELQQLDSQRQVTHNQLVQITGLDHSDDMYAHARAVLLAARAGGYQP